MYGFHFGVMHLNQDVIVKGYLNMNKTISDIFDNGLTKEEQAIVDEKYEEMMLQVKKIDYNYYLTNQIEKPVFQIFELVMKNPAKIIEDLVREEKNKKSGNASIKQWFSAMNKNKELDKNDFYNKSIFRRFLY